MKPAFFALFVMLQLGDAYTTLKIIEGGGRERFAIMKKLIGWLGLRPALAVKTVLAIGLVALIYTISPWWVLFCLCVYYAVIVGNNFYVLRGIK